MSYLGEGSPLRLKQDIQEYTPEKTHHHSHATDSPYPSTHWRNQSTSLYPHPYGYTVLHPHGISYLDFQSTRRALCAQAEATAAAQRSLRFQQAQEEQRRENEREAEAKRIARVDHAVNKMRVGIPLTVEDAYAIRDHARKEEQWKLDRELAGPAGVERDEAVVAAAVDVEEDSEASSYTDYSEDDEYAIENTPHNRLGERDSPSPRQQPRPRTLLHQILQLLGCPDRFRLCPCGLVKRPYRFLA
ncbi:MAG: hypothetical protein Q9210_005560, partial [Variospora velana]